MADIEFADTGDAGDRDDVPVREAVPHVDVQTLLESMIGSVPENLELLEPRGLGGGVGIAAGVEFNGGDAEIKRGVDLGGVGIDEHADFDAGRVQGFDAGLHARQVAEDVEPAFGRHFLAFFRDERALLRPEGDGDRGDLVRGAHFQVELHLDGVLQDADVTVLDVTAILPQVDGDDVGPGQLGERSGPDGVRLDRPSGLPDRGDVVDVDAESWHWGLEGNEALFQPGTAILAVLWGMGGEAGVPESAARAGSPCHKKTDLVTTGSVRVHSCFSRMFLNSVHIGLPAWSCTPRSPSDIALPVSLSVNSRICLPFR